MIYMSSSLTTSLAIRLDVNFYIIVTPPNVTRMILEEGFQLGIKDYMLQPGTLDNNCREYIEQIMLKDNQCNVIESCILVELGE